MCVCVRARSVLVRQGDEKKVSDSLTHTRARARLFINNSTRTSLGEQLEQLLLPSAPTTTTTKRRNRLESSSLLLLTVLPAGSDWLAGPARSAVPITSHEDLQFKTRH